MNDQPTIKETTREQSAILPAGEKAGLCIHFASLDGPHGIGDIGDSAQAFVDTLVSMKISVWQFLPTGPTAYGDSPYQPLSAFAGNEMLIGLAPLIRLGLLTKQEAEVLTGLSSDSVDYGNLIPVKEKPRQPSFRVLLQESWQKPTIDLANPALKWLYATTQIQAGLN